MTTASQPDHVGVDIREYPRMKVPVPFSCAVAETPAPRWFAKRREGIGVVYDVSIKGMRLSSEALINPGDQLTLHLRVPKQPAPLTVERATVRWAKDNTYGLEFMHLTALATARLKKYLSLQSRQTA